MKKSKLSLLALLALSAGCVVGCANKEGTPADNTNRYAEDLDKYEEDCTAVYEKALGSFKSAYDEKEDATSVSERYALEAIAEAKLYESGVFLPTRSRGGSYALTRTIPKSASPVMWGNDADKQHNVIAVTEPIKAADRETLNQIWIEESAKGQGQYQAKAKAKLVELGYTLKTEYNWANSKDPATYDILATSKQADTRVIGQCIENLLEYDVENTQKPAAATSYEVSADGTKYTFHIREGQHWYDKDGQDVGTVKAIDWVHGLQHMHDAGGGLDWLIEGVIKNYSEYVAGTKTFDEVGVKAVDDYTLEYELTGDISYFITMITYSCFAPLPSDYYAECGGKYGDEFDKTASTYTFGTDEAHFAANGAYLTPTVVKENKITFEANDHYWNKDAVQCKKLNWKYYDGKDTTATYKDFKSGVIDGCTLTTSTLSLAATDGYSDYKYITETDSTAFCGFFNINRAQYGNAADQSKGQSGKTTVEARELASAALANKEFRLAIAQGFDRGTWNGAAYGDDLKTANLTNGYTPANFVKLSESVTVEINGTSKTYEAGTLYGKIVQDQLDADDVAIKYLDADKGVSSGFDGWYNKEAAAEHIKTAVKELKKEGYKVTTKNPVHIDYGCQATDELDLQQANIFKSSVEEACLGYVVVDINKYDSSEDFDDSGYNTDYGYEANYDLYTGSGWGPDYGDPCSYLDTMLPEGQGYMTKTLGIW